MWAGSLAAGVLVVTLVLARSGLPGPPCLFRTFFGIPCPGCGMTRSLESIWRGELGAAIRYNPLGPLVFAVLVAISSWSAAYAAAPGWRGWLHRLAYPIRHAAVPWLIVVLLIGTWLVRLTLALMHGAT